MAPNTLLVEAEVRVFTGKDGIREVNYTSKRTNTHFLFKGLKPFKPHGETLEIEEPIGGDATYKASIPSEKDDDAKARETSLSTEDDAVTLRITFYGVLQNHVKMDKKLTSKRRKADMSCTSSEHSQAVEVVVSNEDLRREILFRVPAKSLLKFKSVSKHWRFLISLSSLIHSLPSTTPANSSSSLISGLYFFDSTRLTQPLKSISLHGHLSLPTLAFLDPILEGSGFRVVDSCNGLLLFLNDDKMEHIICNPTTQKYVALPQLGGSTSYSTAWGFDAYLAFDPSKSSYYKVVLVSYHSWYNQKFYIHSSKSASWKEMRIGAPFCGLNGVSWNGAIHWMSRANDVHIWFDIDAENMSSMPMLLGRCEIWYFGECGGNLILIQTEYHPMGFRALEMKKDCCHWIVKHWFSVRPLRSESTP